MPISRQGIEWLRPERRSRTLLLMCMEAKPWNCHRHLNICGPHFPNALHIHGNELMRARDLDAALEASGESEGIEYESWVRR